jgi:PhoPQ-activated pathogenicity-related protein
MKMKTTVYFIIFCFTLRSCQSSSEHANETSNKYFDYDQIDYYYSNIDDQESLEISTNKSKSEIDSFKYGII